MCEDYSPPMLAAYRAWLREQYVTDAALRAAWGDAAAALDTAAPPGAGDLAGAAGPFLENNRRVIDFRRCFSATTARAIARIAGAHLWCRSGDIIYADNRLVAIHAATAGDKLLTLPKPQRVTDLYTGQVISAGASEVTCALSRGETLLAGLD